MNTALAKTVLLAQLSFGTVLIELVTCHCSCDLHTHTNVSHCVSERCSLVMSQKSFAAAHDLLITCFQKSKLLNGLLAEHVAQEGYSIDSTHTEPCTQAQSWATDFR